VHRTRARYVQELGKFKVRMIRFSVIMMKIINVNQLPHGVGFGG